MAKTGFERARRAVSATALVVYVALAIVNEPPERPVLNEVFECAALILLTLALIGRTWAALYLSGRKNKVLTTTGPYSLTRNPLYFFSLLAASGIGLLTESFVLFGALVAGYLLYYHFIIHHEERRLRAMFGPIFDEYCRRTPRLFPKLRGYQGEEELTVRPRVFMKSVVDSSFFLWAFFALELTEAIIAMGGPAAPVLFRLP